MFAFMKAHIRHKLQRMRPNCIGLIASSYASDFVKGLDRPFGLFLKSAPAEALY